MGRGDYASPPLLGNRTMKNYLIISLVSLLCCISTCGRAVDPVVICILDSGCDQADAQGWNFLENSEDLTDAIGHGTQISALMRSCAPEAEIWMLKCFEEDSALEEDVLIQALYAAVDVYHADIISMSWTILIPREPLREAIRYAFDRGAILVASAGNLGLTTPFGSVVYPAGWDEVIGVGGVNLDKEGAVISSLWYLASEAVFVCARGDRGEAKGSSYAVPRVVGSIASHLAQFPYSRIEGVQQMLQRTALDLGLPGYDTTYGWGYIGSEK